MAEVSSSIRNRRASASICSITPAACEVLPLASGVEKHLVSFLLGEELVSTYYIATFYGKCVALIIPPITAVLLSNISKGIIPLDKKMVNKVVSASLGAIAFFFLAGIPASRIIIYLLYRSSYQAALPIMDIGNLGQIIYYSL